jgi:hypothetical protein
MSKRIVLIVGGLLARLSRLLAIFRLPQLAV